MGPLYTSGSHAKAEAASYLVLRYAGPRGRPPSPWLGRRPRRTPGGDRGCAWRCSTAGAGGPTLSRAAVLQPLPSQALLLANDTSRRPMPRQDDTVTGSHDLPGWPWRIGPQAGAITHRFYSLACARCTIAWARRMYLLSARSRTVLTPSVSCRASASLLDRPKAVSGASTSAANCSGPDSAAEGGVVSDLSDKASRWWLGVRPARARQGPCWRVGPGPWVGRCSAARRWSEAPRRSAARPGPGRRWCRRSRPGSRRRCCRLRQPPRPGPGTPPSPPGGRCRHPCRPARPDTSPPGPRP